MVGWLIGSLSTLRLCKVEMKSFWITLLQKAIAALLAKDWDAVVSSVYLLMGTDIPGEQKREQVYLMLRDAGVSVATWLL